MENSEIRLLLLDFDGTLADTRRANTLSYVAALGEAGYTLTEEEYAANYFGMRCNEFLTRFGIADPAERERLRLRKIALYPTFFDTVRQILYHFSQWTFSSSYRSGRGAVRSPSGQPRARMEWGRMCSGRSKSVFCPRTASARGQVPSQTAPRPRA